jgi:tetratricopeptide (TPR) repeat protein
MIRLQWMIILSAALLFAGLYFGFDNKPKGHEKVEIKRVIEGSSADFVAFEKAAKTLIPAADLTKLEAIAQKANAETNESSKIQQLKELAGAWFQSGSPLLSSNEADKIAELEKTDAAWSIAGASWQIAGSSSNDQKTRDYCGKHAISAFENAVSLKPNEIAHQVNLAAVYADFPPADNPMKAVLMLKDLEAKNPANYLVLNALGRLAIQTGQWEKAIARFEKSLSIDPKNRQANCLLADAYEGAKQIVKAAQQRKRCEANK